MQQITLQPEVEKKNKLIQINKMNTSPESITDETVVISTQAASLNNTLVLNQISDTVHAKHFVPTTPHRQKLPIDTRCLTKSITRPAIHKKKLVINNHKIGAVCQKFNQENTPLIMAATRTLADPTLTRAVTKSRINTNNNILTAKSGKLILKIKLYIYI